MVEAIKISTLFSDQKILGRIADRLLSEGIISGFHIDTVLAGYIFAGQKVEENQYSLEILIDASATPEIKEKIKTEIATTLGEKWEVPVIEEERINVNERLLSFIKRAEIEHRRYLTEKGKRLVFSLAALISLVTAVGVIGKKYINEHEEEVVAMEKKKEREKNHTRIEALTQDIQAQIADINQQIEEGKPFTVLPNDMSGVNSYEETNKLLKTVRGVEFELRKLTENTD